MITLNQVIRKQARKKEEKKSKVPALDSMPQKSGICLKVFTQQPKKPNSAQRCVARVALSNSKIISAYVPGEGYVTISTHSIVLVRGGRVKDLPGVRYHLVRNKYDLDCITVRLSSRSKYGTRKLEPVE